MGIDFDSFFNEAGKKAEESLNDLVKVGVPVMQASLEQWGIDVLQKQNKATQQELNQAVKDVVAKDSTPGSFGAAVSATVQGSILQTYGMEITLGISALILIGFFLRGK